jgi:hypothetical protein
VFGEALVTAYTRLPIRERWFESITVHLVMNEVPDRYQNVINPWMNQKEIAKAIVFIDKILKKLPIEEHNELLGLSRPKRDWSKPC